MGFDVAYPAIKSQARIYSSALVRKCGGCAAAATAGCSFVAEYPLGPRSHPIFEYALLE